jgi:hypothetical protein
MMSVEENNNENEAPVQVDTPEVAPVVEPAPAAAQQASEANAANVLASVLALREANPKVFYGGAAGVLLILIFLFSGGSDAKLPVHQAKPVVIGQNYQLKSANAYDPNATIRLVSVPGSMAAYDDTEENDREGCKHIPDGTPVKVIQSQDAYGKKDVFVEVEMTSGECEGKRGWALAINLQ